MIYFTRIKNILDNAVKEMYKIREQKEIEEEKKKLIKVKEMYIKKQKEIEEAEKELIKVKEVKEMHIKKQKEIEEAEKELYIKKQKEIEEEKKELLESYKKGEISALGLILKSMKNRSRQKNKLIEEWNHKY